MRPFDGLYVTFTSRRRHAPESLTYFLPAASPSFPLAMAPFIVGGGIPYSCYPTLRSMPTLVLSESAAAASFALINSVGHLGGLAGPYAVGALNDQTGSMMAALVLIGVCFCWRRVSSH
ncbi:MAG TPA: hypothetical protein VMT53_00385 [Terriglobales bacterium]|nr:hypothetical protein [Terriglobales bacterium]